MVKFFDLFCLTSLTNQQPQSRKGADSPLPCRSNASVMESGDERSGLQCEKVAAYVTAPGVNNSSFFAIGIMGC